MADKLLKSIKFPTLPDRYVIGDSTLTEEGAAADAKAVGDALATKADTKGRYEDLIVGGAEQLMADGYETDTEPYLFRPTGGSADVGNREYLDKIVGGTVGWNQLVTDGNFTDASSWITNNATMTVSNNIGTVTQNNSSGYVNKKVYTASGHRCLAMLDIKGVAGKTYSFNNVLANFVADGTWQTRTGIFTASDAITYFVISQRGEGGFPAEWQIRNACIFDLTALFNTTIADYIYSLEQANAGAGVAWFKKLFPKPYYAYNAGELMSVQASSHDTVGFNAFDVANADLQPKNFTSEIIQTTNVRTDGYIKVVAGATYNFHQNFNVQGRYILFYDADLNWLESDSITNYTTADFTFTVPINAVYLRVMWYNANGVSVAQVTNGEVCINLSSPSRNGEYEEYVKHSYPLDNSLTLRGVTKLVDGKLAFDGDVYLPSGEVQRRYGIVDLGTLTWEYNGTRFKSTQIPTSPSSERVRGVCSKYPLFNGSVADASDKSLIMGVGADDHYVYIKDSAYSDATVFKNSLSGVYLVYELATPTTETAEGYEQYQRCDPSGTEEFVTTGIVPVGHETRYPHDLKKKIETAPDSPSTDGTYLMKRSGGKNAYMALPSTPSANGAYVLTMTVSGGTASYSWTAKE